MAEHFSYQSKLREADGALLSRLERQAEAWLCGEGSETAIIADAMELYTKVEGKDFPNSIEQTLQTALSTFATLKDATTPEEVEVIAALSGGGTYIDGGDEDSYRTWADKRVIDTALTLLKEHPEALMLYNGTPKQNAAFPETSDRIIISDAEIKNTKDQLRDLAQKLQEEGPLQGKKSIVLVASPGQFLRLPFYAQNELKDLNLTLYAHPASSNGNTLHEAVATELVRLIEYRSTGDLSAEAFPFANT